jgi:hypothetical protein
MKRSAALSIIVLLAATLCVAGARYDFEVTDYQKKLAEEISLIIAGPHAKIVVTSKDQNTKDEVIFDGDRREFMFVDHEEQAYFVFNEETAKTVATRANQAKAMMDEALANLPPDQQAKVREMMQQQAPPTGVATEDTGGELKNTGEHTVHAGNPCLIYEMWRGGRKVQEFCVTPWDKLEGGAEVADSFEAMTEFFAEIRESVPMFAEADDSDEPFFKLMKEMGGLVIVATDLDDDGEPVMVTMLKSAKTVALDRSDIGPPTGYDRRTMGP